MSVGTVAERSRTGVGCCADLNERYYAGTWIYSPLGPPGQPQLNIKLVLKYILKFIANYFQDSKGMCEGWNKKYVYLFIWWSSNCFPNLGTPNDVQKSTGPAWGISPVQHKQTLRGLIFLCSQDLSLRSIVKVALPSSAQFLSYTIPTSLSQIERTFLFKTNEPLRHYWPRSAKHFFRKS